MMTEATLCRYVLQDDRLMPNLTVQETLSYAGQLRHLTSKEQVAERVETVINDMELGHVRHSRIGDEFQRGISGGQRRRFHLSACYLQSTF